MEDVTLNAGPPPIDTPPTDTLNSGTLNFETPGPGTMTVGGAAEFGELAHSEELTEFGRSEWPEVPSAQDEPPLEVDADLCDALAADLWKQGRTNDAETFYRAALALAPDRSSTWANLALAVLQAGRADEAVHCERQALRLDPENVDALNGLGIALHASNALPEAENHFRGVLRLSPDHADATLNLGVIRQTLGHVHEAETLYRRALAVGAEKRRVCNNLALALAEQDRLEEAETVCREALSADPDYPEAAVNLGMILLARGQLKEAWPYYEARWRVPPLSRQAVPEAPRWTGVETIQGKTILLHSEQGFGDTLQFCRYAPMVAKLGAAVILATPTPLVRVMTSLEGIDRVVSQEAVPPAADFHCPMMSLPMVFGTTAETIPWRVPYLAADGDAIKAWENRFGPSSGGATGRRAGLAWAGASRPDQPHAAAIDRRRSMRLSDLAPLAGVEGWSFVSLQPGASVKGAPVPISCFELDDFADTAALMEVLDLVITVDTAVTHLAGALGKPVWLLNRFDACWRWPRDRDDSAWYPTMRIFRQASPGDWADVIRRVAAALPGFQTIA
jgi:Flp pilus assembly protein TadD